MDNARKLKIEQAFAHKPNELQHLYVDTNGQLRDRHIEDMFKTLFNGDEMDDLFKNNFTVYFHELALRFLPGKTMEPGPEVFTRADIARAWVTMNFGLLHVARIALTDPVLNNPVFADCHFEARLRCGGIVSTAVHYCYAPSELHATLLTVVNVYRELARQYHNEVLSRS